MVKPEFKLYLIKEFQRLKEQEAQRDSIEWQVKRELSNQLSHPYRCDSATFNTDRTSK